MAWEKGCWGYCMVSLWPGLDSEAEILTWNAKEATVRLREVQRDQELSKERKESDWAFQRTLMVKKVKLTWRKGGDCRREGHTVNLHSTPLGDIGLGIRKVSFLACEGEECWSCFSRKVSVKAESLVLGSVHELAGRAVPGQLWSSVSSDSTRILSLLLVGDGRMSLFCHMCVYVCVYMYVNICL